MARVKRAVNAQKKRRDDPRAGQRLPRSALAPVPQGQGAGHPLAGLRLPTDRKDRKGDFRRLWIQRINAAARAQRHDLQPVHPGPEGRRGRGRPPHAGRAGRQRRGRVRRAGRDRARCAAGLDPGRLTRPVGPWAPSSPRGAAGPTHVRPSTRAPRRRASARLHAGRPFWRRQPNGSPRGTWAPATPGAQGGT